MSQRDLRARQAGSADQPKIMEIILGITEA
jgi:hypothetical protein